MRLEIAGDADARLKCGDACAEGVPLVGADGRGGADSRVEPLIGS